jgi:hypothetical protein
VIEKETLRQLLIAYRSFYSQKFIEYKNTHMEKRLEFLKTDQNAYFNCLQTEVKNAEALPKKVLHEFLATRQLPLKVFE